MAVEDASMAKGSSLTRDSRRPRARRGRWPRVSHLIWRKRAGFSLHLSEQVVGVLTPKWRRGLVRRGRQPRGPGSGWPQGQVAFSVRLTTLAQAVQRIQSALTWSTLKTAVPIAAAKSSAKNRLTAPPCRLLRQTCCTASTLSHAVIV